MDDCIYYMIYVIYDYDENDDYRIIQVDQFPFLGGEDCKPGVKGEEEWGPSPQVTKFGIICVTFLYFSFFYVF